MPRQPPNDPRHIARLLSSMIPDEIAKSITNDEYNDRLVEAARLGAQASDPALSPALRQAARIRARAVLQAQPRAVTQQQHREMVAKATQLPAGWRAEMVREHARRLLEEEHPVAPRRGATVKKAKAASVENDPVVLFDADGRVLGICDPADIMPVDGATPNGELTPQPPGEAGIPAQDVAKSADRIVVYDQWRRPYLVRKAAIRTNVRKAPADELVTLYDSAGRPYTVNRAVLGSPETQARDTGPVKAGGTTGMGQPRKTGPAGSLPGDGPQKALPADLADRQVVKSLGPDWTEVRDYRGSLVGAVKRSDITALPAAQVLKGRAAETHANVYNSARQRVGVAKLSAITPLLQLRATRRPSR